MDGWIADGLCLLWRLVPALAQLLWLRLGLPLPHALLLSLGGGLLQGLLLSPWRLARVAVHRGMPTPFAAGWRLWRQAVAWRWALWWRRCLVMTAAWLPAAVILARGQAAPVLWLPLWAVTFLLGTLGGSLFLCRYAAAPVLILQGYPVGAAVGLSPRLMRGHRRDYVDVLARRWWMGPRFHRQRVAVMTRAIQAAR